MAELEWYGDRGFLEVDSTGVYGEDYFKKYEGYAGTELGRKLTAARVGLVRQFLPDESQVVDVGIGCGQFVEARPNTLGYDVNPSGVEWLIKRGLFLNPYLTFVHSMSFWDSLEHIREPRKILESCWGYTFVSIPIFRDRDHVLGSKHYRPDEHYHYFTHEGFVRFMNQEGFELLGDSGMESALGREDISTFVFRRAR